MWSLGGGAFLGWSLGANDAANVFGTAVASRVVRFSTAATLCAAFIILGAVLEGERGIHTLSSLSTPDMTAAIVASVSAALVVTFMTRIGIPVSTSQAVIGAILGIGLYLNKPQWGGLGKVVICWVATPIGACGIAMILYFLLGFALNRSRISMLTRDNLIWGALVVVGIYGSYALGANNVANVTGVYYVTGQFDSPRTLALIGGIFMALGVVTYSREVMMTVGARLVQLDAYAALVATSAEAMTVHVFAWLGVPVSTSQAIVGALVGVGLMRGAQLIRGQMLSNIAIAWVLSPVSAAVVSAGLYAVFS